MKKINAISIRIKLTVLSNLVFVLIMICIAVIIISKEKKQIIHELKENIELQSKSLKDLISFGKDMIYTVQHKDLELFSESSKGDFSLSDIDKQLYYKNQSIRGNKKVIKQIRKRLHKTHGYVSIYEKSENYYYCINSASNDRIGFKISQTVSIFNVNSINEIKGESDFDFYKLENAQKYFEEEKEIIRTPKGYLNRVQQEVTNEGEQIKTSLTKLPLINEEGKVIGTFGISKRISNIEGV